MKVEFLIDHFYVLSTC